MGRDRPWGNRLRCEDGVALLMALGIVLVVAIVLATTITFTAAGSRDASRVEAGQQAKALAEAGLNNALAHISGEYPSPNKAGNGTGAVAGGPSTFDAGTFTWTGTFDSADERWYVTGTGVVPNPTGPGAADIQETATAEITVHNLPDYSKFGIYVSDPSAACTTLAGGISVNVPVYVASCLTTSGNNGGYPAKIWDPVWEQSPLPASPQPTVSVHVGTTLSTGNNAKIGTPTKRISWVSAQTNNNPGNVFALSYPSVPLLDEIHVDASLEYAKAAWSSATCSSGSQPFDNNGVRDNSKGTVTLLTLASYDCTARDASGSVVGRLAWDNTNKRMEIEGRIFIDGNLHVANSSRMQYSGDGTIYFNGTVRIEGVICAPGSTFSLAGSLPSPNQYCSMEWEPDDGKMMIVAANAATPLFNPVDAFVVTTSHARLEVATWTVGDFRSDAQVELGGSVLVERGRASIAGGGLLKAFISLPSGAPTMWTLAVRATNFR